MNSLFQLTVYTGHQLALAGLQRWLRRPCQEAEQQRQRRTSLKSLIVLLVKTAATGVLATVLDAAIEYRRRQIVAAASQSNSSNAEGEVARFPFSMLSRAGISAWKARLLIGIDELERQAERYGIEPTHRFSQGKPSGDASEPDDKLIDATRNNSGGVVDDQESQQRVLANTVAQLRLLVKDRGEDGDELLEEEVDNILDTLMGGLEQPRTLDSLKFSNSGSSSSNNIAAAATDDCAPDLPAETLGYGASRDGPAGAETLCQICMDCHVRVKVDVCQHSLCFSCARRICESQDHQVPHCPFCRQTIDGFAPC